MKGINKRKNISETNILVAKEYDQKFSNVELDYQRVDKRTSWLAEMKYRTTMFNHHRREFFDRFPLLGYSLKRIFFAIITLLLAICVIFILLRLVTPDDIYISDIDINKLNILPGTPEYNNLLEQRMKIFGVYGSIWTQLGTYLYNIMPFIKKTIIVNSAFDPVTGQLVGEKITTFFYLGVVFSTAVAQPGELVSEIFARAIPYSFAFGSIAVLLAYLIGVPLGIISAKHKERSVDNTINAASIIFLAIPPVVLVVGVYLISINVFYAHGLFSSGTFDTKFWPVFAIFLMITPPIVLNTRRYVIDEMTADYTNFALSKGMTNRYIFYIHIFRNAGIRIFRLLPTAFVTTIFGASIFAEQNWSIPGMSKFIVSGVGNKDSFVVMGYILLTATSGIVTSLLADIIMAVLDPRVKLTK
ncbi:oligopeptide ABC transporter permease [Spiroplasma sp. NBRC 100390]|uniref:oligopeptide ABC transporter permease OppB n=1 Tax=unclassified Spiroplasma TaxID=2637901 RepID=UPI00089294CB|nr:MULTISPECIES: oligopeptide ABC transporter permease OppB [unclassified Spiroplasma]AOX43803.1 oligopeptide ABC transporter permease [Spiroplasma sp. TU-14]APE13273.1 oligopeptide ABC transporter permease [Spiroplasma sp. NBRC 100390]